MAELTALFERYRQRVEATLDRWLPPAGNAPKRLHEAMRYSTFGGGKRLRPILVYSTGAALGVADESLDAPAAAVELIHTYSLVHDDLPAMDDDDLRRGRATCHCAYDEATAILVGDALQVLAFQLLARDRHLCAPPEIRLRMIAELAEASGTAGMAGGQALDLAATGGKLGLRELEGMHRLKTGALFRACVRLGALAARGVTERDLDRLSCYADCVGLAFQIRDDILDVEGQAEVIGKQPGADSERDKPTYASTLGLDEAKRRARELYLESLDAVAHLGEAATALRGIAEYIVQRPY